MGYIEFIDLDENGVTVTPLDELSIGDKLEVEINLAQGAVTLLCLVCLTPVPSGMGHSYCSAHKPDFPACPDCGNEMPLKNFCVPCWK